VPIFLAVFIDGRTSVEVSTADVSAYNVFDKMRVPTNLEV
jgi:hypothetical protein